MLSLQQGLKASAKTTEAKTLKSSQVYIFFMALQEKLIESLRRVGLNNIYNS